MDKSRLEALSDGIFAFVLTLLIVDIKVPEFAHMPASNMELWHALISIAPLLMSYFVSFFVITMFYLSHSGLFSLFIKNVNYTLINLNLLYLCSIAFIPFSAHLIGVHSGTELAYVLYGLNLFITGLLSLCLLKYAVYSKEIDTSDASPRLFKQAHIRLSITPFFSLIGMGIVFYSVPLALVFFAFPIIFNVIPGSLNFLEKRFNLNLE